MILREIGEDGDIHMHPPDALLVERVAAHFHHDFAAAGGYAVREDLQQVAGLGRGVLAGTDFIAYVSFDGADQDALAAGGFEELLEQ